MAAGCVQGGAHAEAWGLTVSQVAVAGLEVKDEGSSLTLRNSTLKDFQELHIHTKSVCGVHVHECAKAALMCVAMARMWCGVDIRDRAHATVEFCEVEDTADCCIACTQGARGSLTRCVLSGSRAQHGAYVGTSSHMDVTSCRFLQNALYGACAYNGGKLVAEGCMSMGNMGAGFGSLGGANVTMTRCSSDMNVKGVDVVEGGQLRATKSRVNRSTHVGVNVQAQGKCVLTESKVTNSGTEGVLSIHEGTDVKLTACDVDGAKAYCVFVGEGAKGTVRGCTLDKSATESGLACIGQGTTVEVATTSFASNAKYGALAAKSSVMVAKDCISKFCQVQGFIACHGARLTVRGCRSECAEGDKGTMTTVLENCTYFSSAPPHGTASRAPVASRKVESSRSVRKPSHAVPHEAHPASPRVGGVAR